MTRRPLFVVRAVFSVRNPKDWVRCTGDKAGFVNLSGKTQKKQPGILFPHKGPRHLQQRNRILRIDYSSLTYKTVESCNPISDAPWWPHSAVQHAIGHRVFYYLFKIRIPSNFPSQDHGDISKVTDRRRAVTNFGRRYRHLARLDAIEEIAPVSLLMAARRPG